jgi:YD repeat-containing protein
MTQGELARDVQRLEATTGSNPAPIDQMVAYGYTLGNLSGISYPSSRQLGLTWVDGEVTGITLGGMPLITQIAWTPFAGAVKRWGWAMASGTKANERYFDLAGRAVRYPLGEALRDVCYDEASRIVGFTHLSADGTAQPALDQAFGWDENSRLTSITTATSSWSISCDPNGNRARIPRAASRWCFIRTDHLSTPRVVVDRRNRVRWRRLADPFGMAAPETNPRGLGVFPENQVSAYFLHHSSRHSILSTTTRELIDVTERTTRPGAPRTLRADDTGTG